MAEHLEPEREELPEAVETEQDDALRRRLLSRIAVAGVAIVGLLGGLAVYDSLNKPQVPALPKMAALPSAEEAQKAEDKPIEAGEQKPDEKAENEKTENEKAVASESVPERTETPLAPMPADKPLKAAKQVTPPATARQAGIRPAEPAAAPAKVDARREIARVMPEESRPTTHAPASRPLTQAAETARRFLVQVGVFGNHANAEELVTKLQAAGIPARIESHVQVGPFASRAEVDAARAKLKSLGLDDGMLVRR